MFSGKSFSLLTAIQAANNKGLKTGVFEHPANNRNSSRDLSRLSPSTQIFNPGRILGQEWDLLVFDEVHFYECFGDKQEFLLTLRNCHAKTILLSGLEYDFYNYLQPFPVWNDIINYKIFDIVEFCNLRASTPCHYCGTWVGVHFTVNIDPAKGRVGDHYASCCYGCAEACFEEYKALHPKEYGV